MLVRLACQNSSKICHYCYFLGEKFGRSNFENVFFEEAILKMYFLRQQF